MSWKPRQFGVYQGFDVFGVRIQMYNKNDDGSFIAAQPVVMERREKGSLAESMLILEDPEAVNLMDALWAAGVRPSNGEGNVGQIGALQKNSDDLRSEVDFDRAMLRRLVRDVTVLP